MNQSTGYMRFGVYSNVTVGRSNRLHSVPLCRPMDGLGTINGVLFTFLKALSWARKRISGQNLTVGKKF